MKAPLKSVLKNFLDHVEDLEIRRKVYDDQYEVEFQDLKKLTDKLKEDPAYQCSFGLKDVNRPKNRYKDIVPYDSSRVILPKYEGIPGSDYINASYIKGSSGAFAYIAAQGPLPNTVIDFWRMIWICDVQVLVMACNEMEAGKHKCEAYWPSPGEVKSYGNISIELVNTSQICPDFMVRTLLVKCGSEMRDVYQFHYTSWPDHGVPETVQPILDLIRLMRDCQASETVPIVVHCSAGCGRTGTICAVDYVWACLRHGKLDEDFSLYQIALELRRQRIAMIQTKEQYVLAHKVVAAMFEQQLKVIDCHIYENLDEDGEPLMWKEVGKDKEINVSDFKRILNTKEKADSTLTDVNKMPVERKNNSKPAAVKPQDLKIDTVSRNSSFGDCLNVKENEVNSVDVSCKNSESSYSRNSILSQHSNEDSIPFIDDDDVCVRPNCGRAYLNIPSCDTISRIVNCFDPFVDKVSPGTDDSSPDGEPGEVSNKMKDFQSVSSKTLDRNAKISPFRDNKFKTESEIKGLSDSKSDILDSAKKVILQNNRESYPRCSSSEKYQKNSAAANVEGHINESCDDVSLKKVGKATVVRRPSISKLKALFERSGVSSQKSPNDGSKRLLFRNNSHHVSRAGSAPPSLDCMDRSSAVEKESILKLVTRKFRSSSVRTEREMQSKELEKTINRRSAADAVKDGLNSLSRTVSFSLNKTFKSYSPAKIKPIVHVKNNSSNPSDSVAGTYKPKSPDQPKGNSMWYDKSSLPRAVAVVKPTGKFEIGVESKSSTISPSYQKSPDKNKTQDTHFPYLTKPTKLKELFHGLNKKDLKDSTTLWYNESDTHLSPDKSNNDPGLKTEASNSQTKLCNKVLPFLPIVPWKKVGQKSPLSSPDSPKNLVEPTTPGSSTFYTNILETVTKKELPPKESSVIPKCPVPEEIIPLNLENTEKLFWPSSSVSSHSQKVSSDETNDNISINSNNIPEQCANSELSKTENDIKNKTVIKPVLDCESSKKESDSDNKDGILQQSVNNELSEEKSSAENTTEIPKQTTLSDSSSKESNIKNRNDLSVPSELYIAGDVKPAIPKKMVIGKNKSVRLSSLDKLPDLQSDSTPVQIDNNVNKINSDIDSSAKLSPKPDNVLEKNDLYININIKAMKNIEQIENSLRKNPRGAIIDLTSRESYSMEEELVNAVKMLDSSEKNKVPSVTQTGHNEKSKTLGAKSNPKFPGYEVIWPEQPFIPVQKSKSNSKVPLMNKNKTELIDKNAEFVLSIQNKTGICYSPPLRRSPNASMMLAKSHSCSNLDWSEDYRVSSLKDQSSTPTKRLVNEAVVELNTLLNQLTTRTLSEEIEFNPKSKEKHATSKEAKESQKSDKKAKECNIQSNDTVVDSVTLVTKSFNSGTSPKEEEIVFHFPPPPRMPPPPKDDSPAESFSIICKNGNLVVKESKNNESSTKSSCAKETEDKISVTGNVLDRMLENKNKKIPQPAPRKSKQTGALRRSSSYTNIIPPQDKNKGYENIFLDKYQTLSRLQIKSEDSKDKTPDRVVPFQMSPKMSKASNSKMPAKYVNIADIQNVDLDALYKTKQKLLAKKPEVDDVKEMTKNTPVQVNACSNHTQNDKIKMIIDETEGGNSVYGKIYKFSSKPTQNLGGFGDGKSLSSIQGMGEGDIKKKPAQSKKTAPPPPNVKPAQSPNNGNVSKENPDISMIPKKLPSRKLEKAPPPPQLLQKSSSAMIVHKRNLPGPPSHHINFPPSHPVDTKHTLPAVHENVPNLTHRSPIVNKNNSPSVVQNKFVNRGLSHSQSDVSVYLALKERKIQAANQERKILNMKSLLLNKKNDQSMSSSDSDSSYERIFLTNKEEPQRTVSKNVAKEQSEQMLFKKEIPVAPPRSKRRSTTEVQYTKVKAKDASHGTPTSRLLGEIKLKNSEINSTPIEEDPPAIPMKTRDAFEIPEECIMAGSEQKK